MGYRVNPENYGAVFIVPSRIVDKHIRLAGERQLKVLLWALRHSTDGIDFDKLCKELRFDREDARDYLQYWVETGILFLDEEDDVKPAEPEPNPPFAQSKEPAPVSRVLPEILPSKPSSEEIAQRVEESPDMKFLFMETQSKLGRTIGYDGQCTLIMMHDTYGIPIEVILMIIEYAVSVGKTSFHYISAVGKDWGEREIDTIEKADEQIQKLRCANKLWSSFAAMAGLSNSKPTRTQAKLMSVWSEEWGFGAEMIYLAYEEMTNNCSRQSFPYMNKVLESWYNESIKTPDELEAYKKSKKSAAGARKTGGGKTSQPKRASSYDLDEFSQSAIHKPLVYNKNKHDSDK